MWGMPELDLDPSASDDKVRSWLRQTGFASIATGASVMVICGLLLLILIVLARCPSGVTALSIFPTRFYLIVFFTCVVVFTFIAAIADIVPGIGIRRYREWARCGLLIRKSVQRAMVPSGLLCVLYIINTSPGMPFPARAFFSMSIIVANVRILVRPSKMRGILKSEAVKRVIMNSSLPYDAGTTTGPPRE